MKISTIYPVIIDSQVQGDDFYNGNGLGKRVRDKKGLMPSKEQKKADRQAKIKNVWGKTKNALGTVDRIGTAFGLNDTSYQEPSEPVTPPPIEEEKKMSTGVKVGLIAAGLLIVGAIIYFAVKNKAPKSAK
jgi:hypothetical protein